MPQTVQRNFTGGEISPALRSRADLIKYQAGLALCENCFIRPQGGVYSRQGTKFICEQSVHSSPGRLIPFQFSTTQSYTLLFENLKMRVIKDGGLVLSGGGPSIYELTTPYVTADLPRLQFVQKNDVMTIVHPDYDPRELSRLADDNWTLTVTSFSPTISAPTWESDLTASITGATNANPCVITTSAAHGFATDDYIGIDGVGGMTEINGITFRITVLSPTTFELNGIDSTAYGVYTTGGTATRGYLSKYGSGFGSYDKDYAYVVTAVDADGVESLASIVASINTKSLSTTGGVRLRWNAVTGADYYRVYKDPSIGTEFYGWIGDSAVTEFTDFNIAPITSDAPPEARDPFAGAGNDPSTVTYYQQRRVYAHTTNEPQTVFTSQTGIYDSLRTSSPARDDDAVTFAINSNQVNEIRHLIDLDALIVLTSAGEYRVTEGQDEVLTPSTVGARRQSKNGASWTMPTVIDDTIIFVQEKGTRIRDLNYEFADDRYKGNDLSIMAHHLFENYTIDDKLAYADEPYGIVWCVRSDGRMLGLTYQRQHQVWAWHQHNTATSAGESQFESIAVISEGNRDALYAIVKRVINGSTVRYVERFEARDVTSSSNVWCVDSGLRYSGSPATVISGLDHLEGETVAVVADGNVVNGLVVTSGSITLPNAASTVTIGLPFTPAIELLDIDVSSIADTLKGKDVSVSRVIVETENSRGLWVGPKKDNGSTGEMYEVKPRIDDDMYDAINLRTRKEEIYIEPQWSLGGGVRLEQRDPMPMAILSVIPQIDVS